MHALRRLSARQDPYTLVVPQDRPKAAAIKGAKSSTASKPAVNKGVSLKAYTSYKPAEMATWKAGGDVPYSFIAETFQAVEDESKCALIPYTSLLYSLHSALCTMYFVLCTLNISTLLSVAARFLYSTH